MKKTATIIKRVFFMGITIEHFFNLFAAQLIVSTSICPTFANLTPTLVSPSPRHLKTWLIDFKSKFNTLMNFKEISLGKSISFYARIVNSDSSDLDLKLCRNSRVKFKATTRWISSTASFFTSWSLAFFEILSLSAASKVFCSEDFSRFDKVAKLRRVGHLSGSFYL